MSRVQILDLRPITLLIAVEHRNLVGIAVNLFLCGNGGNLLNNVLVNIESLEMFLDHRSGGSNK